MSKSSLALGAEESFWQQSFTYEIIGLVDVLQPVELLHGLLPFAPRMVVPVDNISRPLDLRIVMPVNLRPDQVRVITKKERYIG